MQRIQFIQTVRLTELLYNKWNKFSEGSEQNFTALLIRPHLLNQI